MICLQCVEGSHKGRIFEFGKESIVFGRDPDCDVFLEDSTCSRHHAQIEERDGSFVLVDLKSTNGIFLEDEAVNKASIAYGDHFTVGRSRFEFLSVPHEPTVEVEAEIDEYIDNMTTLGAVEDRFEAINRTYALGPPAAGPSPTDLEELKRANQQMHSIYMLSRTISGTFELEDLYEIIAKHIFDNLADAQRVCIFLVENETDEFLRVLSRSRDNVPSLVDTDKLPVSRAVLRKVEKERTGILATDAMADTRFEASSTLMNIQVRSLMCVPLTAREKVLGAVYVENCTKTHCFTESDLELLTVFGNQAAVAIDNALLYKELEVNFYETVRSLSKALEAKDKYTRGHSGRVAFFAVRIGREMGLSDEEIENVRIAAELHDIGKIAIPEGIINTKRKLTDDEYEIIKQHTELGVEILKPIRFLEDILPIVRHHHERYNGAGYPLGLSGTDIPLGARILNLADAFDAMTTQRPYNQPMSFAEALDRCGGEAGVSFDADCVGALKSYFVREGLPTKRTGSFFMKGVRQVENKKLSKTNLLEQLNLQAELRAREKQKEELAKSDPTIAAGARE